MLASDSPVRTSPSSITSPVTPRIRGIFMANLVAQIGIVVTGGLVRVTGSGLGCPTWPECVDGSLVPVEGQAEAFHKYIEFGNRLLTFVLGILAIAAIVGALRMRARWRAEGSVPRRPILALAAVPLLGTMAQALLGGVTVLTGLHPLIVGAHLLLSVAIIAGCVVLVHRASEPGDVPLVRLVRPEIRALSLVLVTTCAAVIVLGTLVTGAGPHSGDTDVEHRLDIDVRTIAWLHADVVLLFVGLIVALWLALRLTDGPAKARRWSYALLVLAIVQGVVGYTQWFTGVPWALVALHMLLACLVWLAALKTHLSLRARG
ncbi:MAG TPA: COX15/CtaA family protein [Motilibacterales bacterium]|nr:COX15/CtaA family protein [Motilibacterales bacterium]